MRTTELNAGSVLDLDRAASPGRPVFMLNLLRYRERADYGDRQGFEPCSGREAYHERYVPAFGGVAPEGIKVVWVGSALALLVGPAEETWDEIAIVEYPSFEVFRRVVESERYRAEAAHHRQAALEDWRLVAMSSLQLG